ncbi:hypothetical protein THAOC_16863 [Thalassiosira oceanica]|uniref:Uncharacterized protein n=1 Tax=Thalassiosira oceanica TaxID=159749 RepID=K0S8L9_THAOC|nr:hypothetical protein THAOC_16863 [Thalassiosira oceanica]|eukprot:EJK62523.1 hypothetical protein THAOC_16863 [Thalassiosira oceanica]
MSRFSRSHRLLPQGWEIRKDLGGKEKRMLHQQNRQNDRGPDEATTEGLGPWNRVASGPESSSTESSDLAMGDAVSRVRSSEARWVWWVWRVAFCLSHAPITGPRQHEGVAFGVCQLARTAKSQVNIGVL